MIDNRTKALSHLMPNGGWSDDGKSITLDADSEYTIPTEMQISDAIEFVKNDYRALRQYPPIGEQLDAMWKGGQDAEDMKAQIQAVKDAFPKS